MRFRPAIGFESIHVAASRTYPGRIFLSSIGCHLSPKEARRVAEALLKQAKKAKTESPVHRAVEK
jgi:hypothetical protein